VILFEHDGLRRGESALAQLRLESPLVCDTGDAGSCCARIRRRT
jgi:hypothetical protein